MPSMPSMMDYQHMANMYAEHMRTGGSPLVTLAPGPHPMDMGGGPAMYPPSNAGAAAPAIAPGPISPTARLGRPVKAPTGHVVNSLLPSQYEKVLDMTTTEFNRFLKVSNFSTEEVLELRKARRRKKNRLYAKRSRCKKLAKLIELQDTVSKLSSNTERGVSGTPSTDSSGGSASPTQSMSGDNSPSYPSAANGKVGPDFDGAEPRPVRQAVAQQ